MKPTSFERRVCEVREETEPKLEGGEQKEIKEKNSLRDEKNSLKQKEV